MSTINVTTAYPTGGTVIPNIFIDTYMIKANGEYLKVYIYLLRLVSTGSSFSIPCLADVLEVTERDITRALKYWEKEHLLRLHMSETNAHIESVELLPVKPQEESIQQKKEKPSIKEKDNIISFRATAVPAMRSLTPKQLRDKNKDEHFSNLLYVAEVYTKKPLSQNDLNTLSYLYDDLSMSEELIEYLIEYCVSNGKKSFRYMQSVAIQWYQDNITTVDAARAQCQSFHKDYYKIMHAFGLNNQPAPAQIEFMKRWIDSYGFTLDIIIEACNRTIRSIGQPKFQYADSILKKWKDHNVISLDDIKKLESQLNPYEKQKKQAANQFHNFEQRDYDFDAIENQYIKKVNHDQ